MVAQFALLTGAGISSDPPSSLPLGREFGERLRRCLHDAASSVVPARWAGPDPALSGNSLNLLGRLQVCLDGGTAVTELLECFRVTVPNEAHLLAAVHAVRGTPQATLNFDDGIERAYGLLAGTSEPGPTFPEAHRRALGAWRRCVQPTAPLTVLAPGQALEEDLVGPVLVKLRGSAGEDLDASLLPPPGRPSDVDARHLPRDHVRVLEALVARGPLVIAGISGADVDHRGALLPLLGRGRFSWTAAELPVDLLARLRRIDPGQPRLAPAVEGVRASLTGSAGLPPWPRHPASSPSFAERLDRWQGRLPARAAAEAYGWLLIDSGLPARAVPLLEAVLAGRDSPRTRWLLRRARTALARGCTGPPAPA